MTQAPESLPSWPPGTKRRTLILGAAGRDFHNFNVVFRGDPSTEVVGFTAAQIPNIAGRRYPTELAGHFYPDGIPIYEEDELEAICRKNKVDRVVFAYSDVSHEHVMHLASRALAAGADFVLLGPGRTMLRSRLPVIAVSAVRTGCGKSQIARWLGGRVRARGLRAAVLRHPMPYGDLAEQAVQRFGDRDDLDRAACTLEEREEYEPHLAAGNVVFAGVDYARILEAAEREADLVIWDGGNNDFPFLRPDLHVVVMDALRPGQAARYHPGEAVARSADVLVVNKVNSARPEDVASVVREASELRPGVPVLRARSPVRLDDPAAVRGKRALVVEDGPTITHGGMGFGAGLVAARESGVAMIVDPRQSAAPLVAAVYERYPHIGKVLPAVGYSGAELEALEQTIADSSAEVVVSATPVDLARLIDTGKTVVRARYEFEEAEEPGLGGIVGEFLDRLDPIR